MTKGQIKGFTLAELMAVVAIIAILAGIVLGSYWKSMERSVFAEGLNAAHSLAAAADEYYYDHNGTSPSSMDQLAAGLAKGQFVNNAIVTSHFTYTLETETISGKTARRVTADRGAAAGYKIHIYLDTAERNNLPDECVYSNTRGQELCEALGYTKEGTSSVRLIK